jgi:hypothetical protein
MSSGLGHRLLMLQDFSLEAMKFQLFTNPTHPFLATHSRAFLCKTT